MAQTIEQLRLALANNDAIRDKGLVTPENIHRWDNIPYGDDPMQVLDVYCLKGTTGKQPAIISIHGGGWVYGDKELYSHYCMGLAQRGFTIVNFSYRLAPEHRYPAAVQDCCKVLQWVQDHAEEYCIDLNNLFLLGDSAGGQLCFQICTMVTSSKYRKLFDFAPPEGFQINACALNCGCYFIPISRLIPPKVMGSMVESYLPLDYMSVRHELNVMKYVTQDFPPAYVMTAQNDYLKFMAKPLCKGLIKKNVPCELHIFGTKEQKEIGHVFHLNCRSELATQCNDEQCAFFRKYIKS